jgi:TrmH family RNA methyltransferase
VGNDKNVTRNRDRRWRTVLEDVRRLGSTAERKRTRRFVMEGLRLHERAVRSGARIHHVLISETATEDPAVRWQDLREGLKHHDVELVTAPDEVLAELCGGRKTGPVVGIVSRPEHTSVADVLAKFMTNATASTSSGRPLFLVAENVEDPGNVGAMVRTALVAGAAGFAAIGISDPFHPRAVRTSMGSLFRIPVLRFSAAAEMIADCREAGIETVGAVSRGGAPLLDLKHKPREKKKGRAIFLGSEAFGLGAETLHVLDRTVTIAMASEVDSYSVNAAAAILMHEFGKENS